MLAITQTYLKFGLVSKSRGGGITEKFGRRTLKLIECTRVRRKVGARSFKVVERTHEHTLLERTSGMESTKECIYVMDIRGVPFKVYDKQGTQELRRLLCELRK